MAATASGDASKVSKVSCGPGIRDSLHTWVKANRATVSTVVPASGVPQQLTSWTEHMSRMVRLGKCKAASLAR